MPAFHLFAVGSCGVISGSAFIYYLRKLNGDIPTVDCKAFQYYEGRERSPQFTHGAWESNWDLCGPKKLTELPGGRAETCNDNSDTSVSTNKKENPTATRHIILIRHGHYMYDETVDHLRVLTDVGREQASLTGERLKTLGITFNRMVISTKTRAKETGEIIGEYLPDVENNHCSLLEEGRPYPFEPSTSKSRSIKWQRELFKDNPRIEGAFRKYIHRADPEQKEDSYDLIVCHGNVIRYFICRALQFPLEGWKGMRIAHCGITWISIQPNGKVLLRGVGHIGHLPSDLVTFS